MSARPLDPETISQEFHRVPSESGFLVGDGPSLRVWFDDPTLQGRFWSEYRVREPSAPQGPDRFFRHDSLGGWIEVVAGPESVEEARQRNASWMDDHQRLARTLVKGENWELAFSEYAKLASTFPGVPEYPFMAGLAAFAR